MILLTECFVCADTGADIKASGMEGEKETGPVAVAKYPFKDLGAVTVKDVYAWMRQVAELPAVRENRFAQRM